MQRNELDLFKAINDVSSPESYDAVIKLIKKGADTSALNEDNKTPLQLARDLKLWDCITAIANLKKASENDQEKYGDVFISALVNKQDTTAEALLLAGAPFTWWTTCDGNRATHWAVKNRNVKMLELLIDKGADLTIQNKNNQSALQLAVSLEYWDCVTTIANKKVADNNTKAQYTDALFAVIKKANKKKINKLNVIRALINAGADICAVDKDNKTPIQVANTLDSWDYVELIGKTKKSPEKDLACYGDALLDAVIENQEETVKLLLKNGASTSWSYPKPHKSNEYLSCKALHWAVFNKNINILNLLVKYGADFSELSKKGNKRYTPIQLAVELGFWDVVETLALLKPADKAGSKANYDDALRSAIIAGKHKTVKVLINAKAQIIPTSLHKAVKNDDQEMIELLLKFKADSNAVNSAGETPLELACVLGKWKAAESLIQVASFKIRDKTKAGIALIAAVKSGHWEVARYLLNAGAPINERLKSLGYTALHQAVVDNNEKTVRFLLVHHASPTITCGNDETPIELACRLGHWNIAQTLIDYHSIDYKSFILHTIHDVNALIYAIRGGNYTIVKLLLDNHIPCNKFNSEKGTISLYEAAKIKRPDIFSLLIAHGANPNVKNMHNKTSYQLARELGCLLALDYERVLAEGDASGLAEISAALFKQLVENAVEAKEIPSRIEKIGICDKQFLKSTLQKLNSKLITSENNTQSLSSYALIKKNSQNNNNDFLNSTINLLLNFPNQSISRQDKIRIDQMQQQGIEEAADVRAYITRKESINAYIEGLQNWLTQFKNSLIATKWTIKNFWGNWVEVKDPNNRPAHVKDMLSELETLTKSSTQEEVLCAYKKIINTLAFMPTTSRRHHTTQEYYQAKAKEIKRISFNDMESHASHSLEDVPKTPSFCQETSSPFDLYSHQMVNSQAYNSCYAKIYTQQLPAIQSQTCMTPSGIYPDISSNYVTPSVQYLPQYMITQDYSYDYQPQTFTNRNLPLFQQQINPGVIPSQSVQTEIMQEVQQPIATSTSVGTTNQSGGLTDTQFNNQFPSIPIHPLTKAYATSPYREDEKINQEKNQGWQFYKAL